MGTPSRCGSQKAPPSLAEPDLGNGRLPVATFSLGRISSTTRTSARGSCSTSATARLASVLRHNAEGTSSWLACDHRRLLRAPGEGPGGGSVEPASHESVDGRRHFLLDVPPTRPAMKERGSTVRIPRRTSSRLRQAAHSSGATSELRPRRSLCGIRHPSSLMHEAIISLCSGSARSARRNSTTRGT